MSKTKVQNQQNVMGEDVERILGRDAQRMNILAGRAVAEIVRSTLGPKGMDKMLVDALGDIVVTGDGVTILKEMEIGHPAAKMVVEVAKVQEDEVGDGTTTAVVLTGAMLQKAEDLLNLSIHPTVIVNGYRLASNKALEILSGIAIDVKAGDDNVLKNVAKTSMKGRITESESEKLAEIVVSAARKVSTINGKLLKVDVDDIKVEKKSGGSLENTELIEGIVIDKERVHAGMPSKVSKAKIALVNAAFEIEKTETEAEIRITSPDQLQAFMKQEENMLKEMVDKVAKSGATVLLCQKGIDDLAQHYLSKAGIFAVRRVKESDMTKLAKATGARVASTISDLSDKDLGYSAEVEELKIGGEAMTFIRGCKDPKAVTILIRGGTQHIIDEADRSLSDTIKVVGAAIESGKILAGGGSPEIEVSIQLKKYAASVGGREQLAIEAFAGAMEIIPRSLAENGGLDPIDLLVKLKASHEKGQRTSGINVMEGTVSDMLKAGVVEPLKVKTQAIKSASEAAMMILKIDDVIAAGNLGGGAGGPPGGMPPMPDM
ncbi:MAG: thermosome subunit beta [archaeon]